jgi:hypothetical protein
MGKSFSKMDLATDLDGLLPPSCWLLRGSLFDPEDEGDMFLRIVGSIPPDYTVLYTRRYNSSTSPKIGTDKFYRKAYILF